MVHKHHYCMSNIPQTAQAVLMSQNKVVLTLCDGWDLPIAKQNGDIHKTSDCKRWWKFSVDYIEG